MLGPQFGSAEHPISPSHSNGPDLFFDLVGVYGHFRILQEDLE